jgi:hypothetical protein
MDFARTFSAMLRPFLGILSLVAAANAQLTLPGSPARPAPPSAPVPFTAPTPTVPPIAKPIIPGLEPPTSVPAVAPVPGLNVPPLSPPVATPAADSLSEARIGNLVQTSADDLVFVQTDVGQGSGFVCNLYGKRVLLTNQHVIEGCASLRFTNLAQAQMKTGAARAAVAHDLIAFDAPEATSAFDGCTDVLQTAAVGDDVVVLGNTEGAGVIKPLSGKLVAVGPNLIEISSEFLPGNSGSPIIHLRSGKVIGIATFATIRKVNSLTGEASSSVRRFGYRLDTVQKWQPVNWQIYGAEAAAAKKATQLSESIIRLLVDLRNRSFNPAHHTEPRLRPALRELGALSPQSSLTAIDRTRAAHNFIRELRNVVQRDVEDLRNRVQYDFFQREVAEESKFRAEIFTGLTEAMKRFE